MIRINSAIRRLVMHAVAACVMSVVFAGLSELQAQTKTASFWYRLVPDTGVQSDLTGIIDFNSDQVPVVRVNEVKVTGRELELLRRALIEVRRANAGSFPVGRRLVLPRASGTAKPDTAKSDGRGRIELSQLRSMRKAVSDSSSRQEIMVLVVDSVRK